jgi:hypothetical protein
LKFGPGDQAGQTQPSHGCRKPVGIFLRRADSARAIAAQQLEAPNVTAEAADGMVVLAMDIIGDRHRL